MVSNPQNPRTILYGCWQSLQGYNGWLWCGHPIPRSGRVCAKTFVSMGSGWVLQLGPAGSTSGRAVLGRSQGRSSSSSIPNGGMMKRQRRLQQQLLPGRSVSSRNSSRCRMGWREEEGLNRSPKPEILRSYGSRSLPGFWQFSIPAAFCWHQGCYVACEWFL